jgi:uncharacterized protein (TIGR02246 family)
MRLHNATFAAAAAVAALVLLCPTATLRAAEPDASLAKQVKQIEDREAIRALLIEYGRELDKRDFAAYSKLFTRDGEWKGSLGSAKTPAGIQKMLEKAFSDMDLTIYQGSFHLMSNDDIRLNGDTATVWSRWTWVVSGPDGRPTPQRAGHYQDVVQREDGHWRFKSRQAFMDIQGPADTIQPRKK